MSQFKVQGTKTYYRVDTVTAEQAAAVGCPTATHTLTGRYETTYGTLTAVTGRVTRQGVLSVFTPYGYDPAEAFKGYEC